MWQKGWLWRWGESNYNRGSEMIFLTLALSLLVSDHGHAAGSPSYAYLKVYSAAVSTSALCTNPVVLFDSATPREINMFDSPTIGGGDLADGTYRCVMMKISDTIRFKPAANDGTACLATNEYNLDVCGSGTSGNNPITGATINCTGGTLNAVGSDTVYIFISTNSTDTTGAGANAFQAPTSAADGARGMNLGAPFVVAGSSAGQFVMDLTNKVDGTSSAPDCDLKPPLFKFR